MDVIKEDEWGGNEIREQLLTPEHQILRIVFGNINGLQLGSQGRQNSKLKTICQEIRHLEIDHLGLAEINCDTCNFNVTDCIRTTVKEQLRHSVVVYGSSELKSQTAFKPGGTLSIVNDDLTGRVAATGKDSMGRWTFVKYRGKGNRMVTVISAYQVCSSTSTSGTTAFAQQAISLRHAGAQDAHPRRHFRSDLRAFLATCTKNGESLIVMGDFNEDLIKNDWLTAIADAPLVDIIASQHPSTSHICTYQGGRTRLDYIFISPDIADSVMACGYFPFRSHFPSDHRFLYIDIDVEACFGCATSALGPPSLREFTPKDPKALRHYISEKHRFLKDHNFFPRLKLLKESDYDPILVEKLDAILTQASLVAANKCRKKRRHWFSLPLHAAIERKMLLQTMLTGYRKAKDPEAMRRVAEDRLRRVNLHITLPQSQSEVKAQLKLATKEIKTIVKDSKGARQQFLEDRAMAVAQSGNASFQKALEGLIRGEQQAEQWSRIRRALKPDSVGALSSIEVPASWPHSEAEFLTDEIEDPKRCSEWRVVDTPKEIEFYIRMRNRLHFGQAQGTPFTIPPLRELIDWPANSKISELILDGEFHDEELDMLAQMLLQHCKRESAEIIENEISKEEFKRRIAVWDERTTTSPSGLHLGHAKALISKIAGDSDKDKDVEEMQSAILDAHLGIINYVLQHGHALERWKTVVNVMIEKDPGNAKIHRLRVIHLYEYDFGAMLGIFWKKMMSKSEKRGTINDGQFGGRKGREAKDLAFLEELKNDICHASRKPLVNFDNDAASCYDRIIPSLASLIGRSKGLHYSIAMIHAKTLQLAKFKLKTALGVSEEEYSHCSDFPIYGTGQGSTNSPIIWTIISSKLFDLHSTLANGATFSTPDKSVTVSFSIVGFVDDSNCQTNSFLVDPVASEDDLIALAESDAQNWSKLLWLSGGYLEIPKCSYHLISFEFKEDGTPVVKGGRVGHPICIYDEQLQKDIRIPSKSAYDPHKTLGHYKAPAGKSTTQVEALKKKANLLAERMWKFPCTTVEAQVTYRALYLGWVTYVMGQCIISPKECQRIESKISSVFATKCGFARTMPLAIRYGPRNLGGAGQVRLYTIQGEGQVQNFLKHWRANSTPGKVAKCAVAWGQIQAGVGTPILFDTQRPLPHLESRMIRSTRDFLASISGQLELHPNFVPNLLRENDFFIMDFALASDRFSPKQLKLINYCRLYLQVSTCAEITEPGGRFLEGAAMLVQAANLPSQSQYLHVNQARPKEKFFKPWKYLCFMLSAHLRTRRLGPWLVEGSTARRTWKFYYAWNPSRVLVWQGTTFQEYCSIYANEFAPSNIQIAREDLPRSVVPVRAEFTKASTIRIDPESVVPTGPTARHHISRTFEEFVLSLQEWEIELLSNVHFVDGGPFETYDRIQDCGSAEETLVTLVGDGSCGNGSMSFGWTLSLPDGTVLVECSGPAYGANESSYRSEGYAFLSSLRFVLRWWEFCQHKPDQTWKIIYYADNYSILHKVKEDLNYDEYWPNTTLEAEWDIRQEIKATIRQIGCPLDVRHVKGHQDDHTSHDKLSIASKLNIRADELAGIYRKWNNIIRPVVPRFQSNEAQLYIAGSTVTSNYRDEIRNAASKGDLEAYTMQKFHWTREQYDSIDWGAFSSAVTATKHRSDQITKLVFDWVPTNKLLHKYDQRTSSLCPRCQEDVETTHHVIRCPHAEALQQRKILIKNLRAKCHSLRTKPVLLQVLVEGMSEWFGGRILEWSSFPTDIQDLIKNQTMVGWDQLFWGRFVLDWARTQDCYLGSLPRKARKKGLTGTRWVKSIIRVIWTHYFELWESRNKAVHGASPQESNSRTKKKLLAELKLIHADRLNYLAPDKMFLIAETEADDHKLEEYVSDHYPSTIKNWLDWHRPLFKASLAEATRKAVSLVRPITDFFAQLRYPEERQFWKAPRKSPPRTKMKPSKSRSIKDFLMAKGST